MYHSYCYASNFLAFLKDTTRPSEYQELLERLGKSMKQRNFQGDRSQLHDGDNLDHESRPGKSIQGDDPYFRLLLDSFTGWKAEDIYVLPTLETRYLKLIPFSSRGQSACWIFYTNGPHREPRAGRLNRIYSYNKGSERRIVAVVQPYSELSLEEQAQADPYRKWTLRNAGRLYHTRADPTIVISTDSIMHHAFHHERLSKELGRDVKYFLPVSKVCNFSSFVLVRVPNQS